VAFAAQKQFGTDFEQSERCDVHGWVGFGGERSLFDDWREKWKKFGEK